jgi:hypothetical protein
MTTIDQIRKEAQEQLEAAARAALEKHALDLLGRGTHRDDLLAAVRPYMRTLARWQIDAEQRIEGIIARGGRPLH